MTRSQIMTRIEELEMRLLSHPKLEQASCAVVVELTALARRSAFAPISGPARRHDKNGR